MRPDILTEGGIDIEKLIEADPVFLCLCQWAGQGGGHRARLGPGKQQHHRQRRFGFRFEAGPDRMGEVIDFPGTDGKTYKARICDPVFFDKDGEKQNV